MIRTFVIGLSNGQTFETTGDEEQVECFMSHGVGRMLSGGFVELKSGNDLVHVRAAQIVSVRVVGAGVEEAAP